MMTGPKIIARHQTVRTPLGCGPRCRGPRRIGRLLDFAEALTGNSQRMRSLYTSTPQAGRRKGDGSRDGSNLDGPPSDGPYLIAV